MIKKGDRVAKQGEGPEMIKKAEVFKWWVADTFSWEEIQEMAHGEPNLKAGLKKFIDKIDVEAIYDRFSSELWAEMAAEAERMGHSLLGHIGLALAFYEIKDEWEFKAAMLWYVARDAAWDLIESRQRAII